MNLRDLRHYVEQQKGSRDTVQRALDDMRQREKDKRRDLHHHEQAREVIRAVGLKTQQELSFHISDLVSLALDTVYDDPYKFIVDFVQRRNRTECDLLFERDGERIDPLNAAGGGVVNIASFALRVAAWSMQRPRSRNLLVMDEAFNNVSADLLPRASTMLKEISDKLKLQILLVTHSEELIDTADRTFKVTMRKGVSHVERL